MQNVYKNTTTGDLVSPGLLTDEDAIAAFESGELEARDVAYLSASARSAVWARLRRLGVSVIDEGEGPRAWCLAKNDKRRVIVAEGVH